MLQKKIPLREIEKSISINCTIDRKSTKALQLKLTKGQTNQSLGRLIFLYIAQNAGYNQEEICDYLAISEQEYTQKLNLVPEFYNNGKLLFETIGHHVAYNDTKDTYLHFYRKLVLAQNYLRYRFDI